MGFFDGRNIEQDVLAARPVPMTAVEAWMGKSYEEVTTREVEDGWVQPWELKEPYPFRIPREPEYRLTVRLKDGRMTAFQYPWLMVQGEGGPPVILLYVGGADGEIQAVELEPGFVAMAESGNTFTWKGAS